MSATNENRGVARYPLPGVPTPILPADIPNKAYVDATVGTPSFIGTSCENGSSDTFFTFYGTDQSGSEAVMQIEAPRAFTIKRITMIVKSNTRTTDTIFSVRKGGVTIAATSITVPNATTGQFSTGTITEVIAEDDLINMLRDHVGGSGSIAVTSIMILII